MNTITSTVDYLSKKPITFSFKAPKNISIIKLDSLARQEFLKRYLTCIGKEHVIYSEIKRT